MARIYQDTSEPKERITCRVPKRIKTQLKAEADKQGVTLTYLLVSKLTGKEKQNA